jgi:hypothetical protein
VSIFLIVGLPQKVFLVQVLFLAELEEIIDIVPVNEFARIVARVCRQLARCVGSWHFQVGTVCSRDVQKLFANISSVVRSKI